MSYSVNKKLKVYEYLSRIKNNYHKMMTVKNTFKLYFHLKGIDIATAGLIMKTHYYSLMKTRKTLEM